MWHDCQAALRMNGDQGLLDAPKARDGFIDEEREQVAVERRHLHAADDAEPVGAAAVQFPCLVPGAERVVLRHRDDLEVGRRLDVSSNSGTVAIPSP